MLPLHLPRFSRPKPTRRHTESADLKIKCSSGPSRKTHSTLSTCTNQRRGTIEHHDVYVCSNAVNAPRLVALTREAMDAQVQRWGGNAMVDESWSYTIQQRKSNHGNSFKVSVKYRGVVAQCERPDPHYPVALEEAKGIPGLMTVISRQ
ncbi:hypothetical protein JB92DRAFT_2698577 [Gautieria morchelliformis]|nr:hypothetical protein JB92DRAFT_2698577 [Gautieria morchelliformis]